MSELCTRVGRLNSHLRLSQLYRSTRSLTTSVPAKANLPSHQKNVLRMTHFIRIPLLNQNSSTQIQETLRQVANDPASATVPPLAYQPLQQLKLSIVALSLETQADQSRAIALLKELGKQDCRKLFSKAQAARSNTRTSSAMESGMLTSEDVDKPIPGRWS